MIGFLRGQVVALKTDYCLLDVNGVGYRVFVAGSTRNKLRLKDEASLYTYMNVYQDGITLYGFATEEEYDVFQLLIGVSGIGPKTAIGILGSIEENLDDIVADILCTSSVRAIREIEPKLIVAMGNVDGMVADLKLTARTEKKLKVKNLDSLPATKEVVVLT